MKKKVVVAVTGASGALYAFLLFKKLEELKEQIEDVAVVFSENALAVWKHELPEENHQKFPFRIYKPSDFNAPFASGSSRFSTMIVCPCSMGTLGRIASGTSDDLISRAADVMLKERRKLILVTRDMPLNLIHVNNMKTVTEAGGIICPASPSFYSRPADTRALAQTVIDRVIDLAGFVNESFRWNEK